MTGLDIEKYNQIPQLIKQGNNAHLNALFTELRSNLMIVLMGRYQLKVDQAEEHVQFALYQLLRLSHRKSFEGAVYRMVFAIAKNHFFAQYKTKKRLQYNVDFEVHCPTEPNQTQEVYNKESMEVIQRGMANMSPMHKQVIELYMNEPNIHYKEAAKQLQVSESNIRTLKSRAIQELRKYYEKYYAIPQVV